MRVTSSLVAMSLGWLVSIIQEAPACILHLFLILIGYQKPSTAKSNSHSNGPPRVRVESRDFQMLSGLRGLAALVVLFRHINVGSYIGGYQGLAELGVFMVATFFVLSAFLLSVSFFWLSLPIFAPLLIEFIVPRLARRHSTLGSPPSPVRLEELDVLDSSTSSCSWACSSQ
jgi:hypothetical protein